MRKFGRAYGEFKKMANGFQGEFKGALDDPLRELRDTAEAMKQAVKFDFNEPTRVDGAAEAGPEPAVDANVPEPGSNVASSEPPPPVVAEPAPGLNFGSMNPRRSAPTPEAPAE